jgi:hypothetical protein
MPKFDFGFAQFALMSTLVSQNKQEKNLIYFCVLVIQISLTSKMGQTTASPLPLKKVQEISLELHISTQSLQHS